MSKKVETEKKDETMSWYLFVQLEYMDKSCIGLVAVNTPRDWEFNGASEEIDKRDL